jgi:hypothetical protein
MMQKLGAFSHAEPAVQRWRNQDDLAKEIAARRFFHDQTPLMTVPLETLPGFIQARTSTIIALAC